MKTKTLSLIASIFGVAVLMGGCSCPNKQHYGHHGGYAQCDKKDHSGCKHHKQNMQPQVSETVVFYQTYKNADIDDVRAKMYTRSSRGGESAMGTIKFKETNAGLKMKVDLIDLRPGKTYTMGIYQCGTCNNDSTCCDTAPMAIDLPTIRINHVGRLEQSYIIRGLTAAQLNNAKLILTRDGGYKAAWGTLKQ